MSSEMLSSAEERNLYPEFSRMLGRVDKERLLGQRGFVAWFYGLSGSGKSTLANGVERSLHARGRLTQILDGDNIRCGLNNNLGFSDEDRAENIRRTAEVARLYKETGILTLCSFITPQRAFRQMAREIVGANDFLEIFVKASFETCARRDVKGLYARAAAGQVGAFTGRDSLFEEPSKDDPGVLIIDTEKETLEESIQRVLTHLEARFPVVA
jgi:adenylylsulfate kinase